MTIVSKVLFVQEQLTDLLNRQQDPAISIILGNGNKDIDRRALKILFKDAMKEVQKQLQSRDYNKHKIQEIEENIEKEIEETDLPSQLKGLGIFASEQAVDILLFPFDVSTKIVVDNHFQVRDLLFAVNRTFQYDIIHLSKKDTRFFNGYGPDIIEIKYHKDFPHGIQTYLEDHWTIDPMYMKMHALTIYSKKVDDFLRLHTNMNKPLVVIGDPELIGYFRKETRYPKRIIAEVHGDYEAATLPEIKKHVDSVYPEMLKNWQIQLLKKNQHYIDAMQYAAGIKDVWKAVFLREGWMLIIEKDYTQSGWSYNSGLRFSIDEEKTDGQYHEDAINDLIEMVLTTGGEVCFVDSGMLNKFDKILLITRY